MFKPGGPNVEGSLQVIKHMGKKCDVFVTVQLAENCIETHDLLVLFFTTRILGPIYEKGSSSML